MGTFSIWHWLIVFLVIALVVFVVWPAVRILHKAGYSGWWSLLMLVPFVNIIGIWLFAFAKWPRLAAGGPAGAGIPARDA